jgi:segregation and condensation protein B
MNEEPKMEVSTALPSVVEAAAELKEIIEALLFASDEQVTIETLRVVFEDMNRDTPDGQFLSPTGEEIRAAIDSLNAEYAETRRAYRIQQLAGGFVFATDKKFAAWVGKLFKEKARRKLSQTAVETLAIIAYKQPITKSEIEFIRGVNADYIMKTLLEKNLATITGRAHSPGRPLLYGTTPDFLKHFGLNEITDLPKPREIEELLGETELEVEKRMLANQEELEFKEKLHEKLDPNSRAPHIPRKKSKLQEQQTENEGKTVIEKATPLPPLSRPQQKVEGEADVDKGSDVHLPTNETVETANGLIDQTVPTSEDNTANAMVDLTDHPVESGRTEPVETPPQVSAVEARIEQPPLILPEPEKIEDRTEPVIPSTPEPETAVSSGSPVASTAASEKPQMNESKKGWSTWKTKIQTFFRKLFG